jgi:hypothetical protein
MESTPRWRLEVDPPLSSWTGHPGSPQENPFLTRAYAEAQRQLGWTPVLFLSDGTGASRGMCPGFLRRGRLSSSLEVPSAPDTPFEARTLSREIVRLCRAQGIDELNMANYCARPGSALRAEGAGCRWEGRREFAIDLSRPDLWSRISRTHRERIKRAERQGLELRRSREHASIVQHLDLVTASLNLRKQRGEAAYAIGLKSEYRALLACGAGEMFQVGRRGGPDLASVLVLRSPTGAYTHSSGVSAEGRTCGAAHLVRWRLMNELRDEGVRRLVLGGSSDVDSGVARFKIHFGADATDLGRCQCSIGPRWKRKLTTLASVLRHDPLHLVRTGLRRWIVFSADPQGIAKGVDPDGWEFRALTDQDFTASAFMSEELARQQRERSKVLGRDNAFAILREGKVAHVSWVVTAVEEGRTAPRLLGLRSGQAEITACFTVEQFRGQGLYPLAIRRIAKVLAGRGFSRVFMKTVPMNVSSQRGIARAGLEHCGQLVHLRLPKILGARHVVLRSTGLRTAIRAGAEKPRRDQTR